MKGKKIYIITPVANEEQNIRLLIEKIQGISTHDLYFRPVIDRFSTDRTMAIIQSYEDSSNKVKLECNDDSTGPVSCYLYGFQKALAAKADIIMEMDAGGSHDPSQIPRFISVIEAGKKIAYSSRFLPGGGFDRHPVHRIVVSKLGSILSKIILGISMTDVTSGYNAYSYEALSQIDLNSIRSKGNAWHIELKYMLRNFSYSEVPMTYRASSSSFRLKHIIEAIRVIWSLASKKLTALDLKQRC